MQAETVGTLAARRIQGAQMVLFVGIERPRGGRAYKSLDQKDMKNPEMGWKIKV